MADDARTEALKSLHTTLIDSHNGYEEAVKQSKPGDYLTLFQEMGALHQSAAVALSEQLRALGEKSDDSGSFMSTVHRTVVDVRSFLTGLGDAVLPAFIDGERRNLSFYDDAIGKSAPEFGEYPILLRQREALSAMIAKMERLKEKAAA